jgi:hypothetical protein
MTEYHLSDAPIEQWLLSDLIVYENNNKKHAPDSVRELAASIKEHGFENPILIEEDNTIISGHGRALAAEQLGMTYVPVRVAKGITKIQARKLRIAANKVTSTDYDTNMMQIELKELQDLDVDLGGMGLTEREFQSLLTDVGEIKFDTLTDDISGSVAIHEEGIARVAEEVEGSEVPLSKAFGFKKVPVAGVRTITRFLGVIEEQTGKVGLDALLQHMSEVVAVET